MVRDMQGMLRFQIPPSGMPDFCRYREKVMLFMREISKAYGERTIAQTKYDEYCGRYNIGLLQSYEDEFHIMHCRIPCKRCSDMENGYLHAIYS